jgi:O-methyltransferase
MLLKVKRLIMRLCKNIFTTMHYNAHIEAFGIDTNTYSHATVLEKLALHNDARFESFGLNTSSFSNADVLDKLAFGVEYIYGASVKGDIAEFGTMSGRTAKVLAQAFKTFNQLSNDAKNLHLFDSFSGFPEITSDTDKASRHVTEGVWAKGLCKQLTKNELDELIARYLPKTSYKIYEGFFNETLPAINKNTTFALVHIDCDLYQSAIEVLDYLFSHEMIEEGAVFFFDDYNCNRSSNEFGERKAWHEVIERFSICYTDHGEYGWAGRKFTVHSYRMSSG